MNTLQQINHFSSWTETNWDIVEQLQWNSLLKLYSLFLNKNPECSIQECVEEDYDGELVQEWNAFCEEYYGFNKFENGAWETRF